jgi:cell division initiation protein
MITPIEIRQHSFKKVLRGYDKDEVAAFLNSVSMEWERLLEDHRRTKQELDKTQSSLDNLRQVETALHKTLLQAEETSKTTMEHAKRDAELKLAEADSKAKDVVKRAIEERSRIEMQINELISRRNEILQQLKSYLQAQTERLKTFEEKEMKSGAVPEVRIPEHVEAAAPVREQVVEVPREEPRSIFEGGSQGGTAAKVIDDFADEL